MLKLPRVLTEEADFAHSCINTSWSERRDDNSCIYSSSRSGLRSRATFYVDFFDHAASFKDLLMLKRETSTSNCKRRKVAISSRRMQGSSASLSYKAVIIGGVMVLGRPAPFDGAFVDPKRSRFDRTCRTERAEQPAISAITSSVGASSPCNLLSTMSFIRSRFERARFGAII